MVTGLLGSNIWNSVIGIAFVYFIFSIVASSVQELISSLLARRAKDLEYGIAQLLGSPQLRDAIYQHPLIKGLGTNEEQKPDWKVNRAGRPSYIPANVFSLALFDQYLPADQGNQTLGSLRDCLAQRAQAGEEAARALLSLIDSGRGAGVLVKDVADVRRLLDGVDGADKTSVVNSVSVAGSLADVRATVSALPDGSVKNAVLGWLDSDVQQFQAARSAVESWFDEGMKRVSGVYKQQVQLWLLGITIVIVLLSGADTLRMWRSFQNDSILASYVTQQAGQVVSQAQGGASGGSAATAAGSANTAGGANAGAQAPNPATIAELGVTLDQLQGVLGYDWPPAQTPVPGWLGWAGTKVLGLALTIFAVSLGAPFWFDVLSKVTNLRSAGPPPAKSGDSAG